MDETHWYEELLRANTCLNCLYCTTYPCGARQRRCPTCGCRWSFGRLVKEWDLLTGFAQDLSGRDAARRAGVSLPTALKVFDRFRDALAVSRIPHLVGEFLMRQVCMDRPLYERTMTILAQQPFRVTVTPTWAARADVVCFDYYPLFVTPTEREVLLAAARYVYWMDPVVIPLRWFAGEPIQGLRMNRDHVELRREARRGRRASPGRLPAHIAEAARRHQLGTSDVVEAVFDYGFRPRVQAMARARRG